MATSLADVRPLIRASARRLAASSRGLLNADDLTQVGMLAAHATLQQAGTAAEDKVRYARQSAKLAMIDLARGEARAARVGGHAGALTEADAQIEDPTPGPEALAIKREMARLVAEAIHQLPQQLRDVLRLTYEREMTRRELAACWGMDPAEVQRLHQAAIDHLRHLLGVQDSGPTPRSSSAAEMFAPDIVRGADARLLLPGAGRG